MNKFLTIFAIILLLAFAYYSYYENTVTEVFVTGKLIAFDVNNPIEKSNNNNIINASSKALGTMTFIKQNGDFAALGHSISSSSLGYNENCYEVNLDKIKKSTDYNPGSIVATANEKKKIGHVSMQSYCGVFGTIEDISQHKSIQISTANRLNVKKGTAYLLMNIDGKGIKKYEVEITGVNFFSLTKNFRIIVKSPELINKTGGIVQGMSGTPVVQNGKLIGAINSVNIQNTREAYGIFVDKLL